MQHTGCGRMDSHISKGNKKRMKQVTEKKLYIFEKYLQSNFIPLGFESNITQVVAVIRDALPKPFSKVFHHYAGHLWRNGGNLRIASLSSLRVWGHCVYKPRSWGIPTGKNHRGSNRVSTRATRYRLARRRVVLGTYLSKFPANDEQCGLWPRPAKTESPLNHQIPPIWAGGSSLTFHNTD